MSKIDQPETNNKLALEQIKSRSISGVIAFTFRTFFLQLIALVATFLLAVFLKPEEFGIFFVVSALVNLFIFLSDIGLAASLIQKKETPSLADLRTTFTIQQILSFIIVTIIFSLTPFWQTKYGLSQSGLYLLYALAISFILASFKTIPSILLERKLDFNKLIIPQLVENLIFYSIAVFLAWKGFGVTSYTIAVLARSFAGVIIIYLLMPWQIGFAINKKSLKGLLKFGVPFQINDFLARIKDDLLIVSLKFFLTDAQIGFVGWAQRWSLFPYRFTVDSVIRVTFPAYSRLQNDKKRLKKAIEKSLYFISIIIFPILAGIALLALPFTNVIAQYQKWQPALIALYLFLINVAWSSLSTPLTNAINAIGKIKITLKLMVFWTILTWGLTIPAVIKFGFVGVALAAALVSFTSVITFIVIKRLVPIQIFVQIRSALIATAFMSLIVYQIVPQISTSLIKFLLTTAIGAFSYLVAILMLERKRLISEIKTLLKK